MQQYSSYQHIYRIHKSSYVKYWFWIGLAAAILVLFLPWTQNVSAVGTVTSLYQDQRPQQLHSPIPGRIAKWYVKNGDQVKKGDTLMHITEVKEDYMDPLLVERTEQQVQAKKDMQGYYSSKVGTAQSQAAALASAKDLKLQQIRNKISQLNAKLNTEQSELAAVSSELALVRDQYQRQNRMYEEGLVSLTQLQQRNTSFQNVTAKKIAVENKILQTQQEIQNAAIEQDAVLQDYLEKVNKIESDRFSSLSSAAGSVGEIAKLENQVANYKVRRNLYYLIASQDGQVVNINKAGIGEMLKEGENIATIVPDTVRHAVELKIKPVDLPLIKSGQKVMFTFDGYPAIVFSGWPNSAYGTFSGKVLSVQNTVDESGYFKAIVVEDRAYRPWPTTLKMGTGAQGIALLNDVPIWYEIWRNINGFPADYYTVAPNKDKKDAKE